MVDGAVVRAVEQCGELGRGRWSAAHVDWWSRGWGAGRCAAGLIESNYLKCLSNSVAVQTSGPWLLEYHYFGVSQPTLCKFKRKSSMYRRKLGPFHNFQLLGSRG